MKEKIIVRGASVHNLKHVNVELPHNQLIVFTGVSGSGKSSLAFDTIYAEAERRYVESLSAYARQFIGQMERAEVEHIEGLSPSISIDQKTINRNPRSTVGTTTEVFDYLRVLFARAADRYCPSCGSKVEVSTEEDVVAAIFQAFKNQSIEILAPLVRERKGEYRKELKELQEKGYTRLRIDGEPVRLDTAGSLPRLERYKVHTIQIVLDRVKVREEEETRVREAIKKAFELAEGHVDIRTKEGKQTRYSSNLVCLHCGTNLAKLDPRDFSFNSPTGMCPTCQGRGMVHALTESSLIADESLSIREGAIGTTTKNRKHITYTGLSMNSLEQICSQLGINIDAPWKELPEEKRKELLFGSEKLVKFQWDWGSEESQFRWEGKIEQKWKGIIPLIERAYQRTQSEITRSRIEQYMELTVCPTCHGKKLNQQALHARIQGKDIMDLARLSIDELTDFITHLQFEENKQIVLAQLLREITHRLKFLQQVGLGYLSLDRGSSTLSGGEAQRIRLAAQMGSKLQGVTYVLDEPSIGLHPRDNQQLLAALITLKENGNTVLVVEHDEETIHSADLVVDLGPGAGEQGGRVIFIGHPQDLIFHPPQESLTGAYLSKKKSIPLPSQRRKGNGKTLCICKAQHNNLKSIDVRIPLGLFVCITGVSGSGKSSLIHDILWKALAKQFYGANEEPGAHESIQGVEHIDKVIIIDQSPIGRNPRSNPATYTKVLDEIRKVFAATKEAKIKGFTATHFSFNTKPGRCPVCEGMGYKLVEMQLLPDVHVKCEACEGKRYDKEVLEIKYKGYSIADILNMSVNEASQLFQHNPRINRILRTLQMVGLGYMKLGQPATTLSGGEAQRMKLAAELRKRATGKTLYIMDEPTTGLHFDDIKQLLTTINLLVDKGNSVIVIEHNLEIIKSADWIIDLGPEGGKNGGYLVAEGTPEEIVQKGKGYTAAYLKAYLKETGMEKKAAVSRRNHQQLHEDASEEIRKETSEKAIFGGKELEVKGATLHNLKNISLKIPKNKIVVFSGPSGSGKTSLVMETIFAEGQRRFVESLSSYARQFLKRTQGGHLKSISGLSPAIAIDQKVASRSPRSIVATSTEIYDYLRVLYANVARPYCPRGHGRAYKWTVEELARELLHTYQGRIQVQVRLQVFRKTEKKRKTEKASKTKQKRSKTVAETVAEEEENEGGYFELTTDGKVKYYFYSVHSIPEQLLRLGVTRVEKNGELYYPEEIEQLGEGEEYVFILDRLKLRGVADKEKIDKDLDETAKEHLTRLRESLAKASKLSPIVEVVELEDPPRIHRYNFQDVCPVCGYQFPSNPTPRMFSFNHYQGACPTCGGLGVLTDFSPQLLIVDKSKSIVEGAIGPYPASRFTRRKGYVYQKLKAMCELIGTQLTTPLSEYTQTQLDQLFYGIPEKQLVFEYEVQSKESSYKVRYAGEFKGLIPHWRESMKKTGSEGWKRRMSKYLSQVTCPSCQGLRLNETMRSYKIGEKNILEFCNQTPREVLEFINQLDRTWSEEERKIVDPLLKEISSKCQFLINVGLDYLTLDRRSDTLSGGEGQRIRLASQLGSNLVGVLYCLDEPTIGLHARDTERLLDALTELRDNGNTLLIIEHEKAVIEQSDYLVDLGPGAGHLGGKIIAAGPTPAVLQSQESITAQWFHKSRALRKPRPWNPQEHEKIELKGVTTNNLKSITVEFPIRRLVCVTGVSGSGKSSLIEQTLYPALRKVLGSPTGENTSSYEAIDVPPSVKRVILVDQSPVSRNPRSNPATYTGAFDEIRNVFALTAEARARGYTAGHFSFNSAKGQCSTCRGVGKLKVELLFLADVYVQCPQCNGKRYSKPVLEITYRGKTIADILDMTINEALEFFQHHKLIYKKLQPLQEVGLGYLKLGQSTTSLSGGEAQRLKLAAYLHNPIHEEVVFILDEPTIGLHASDVDVLLQVLSKLVDQGNTVIVVEHNLDVIKAADWIIDLGPEGGEKGGQVVAVGPPGEIMKSKRSWTGYYLRKDQEEVTKAATRENEGV